MRKGYRGSPQARPGNTRFGALQLGDLFMFTDVERGYETAKESLAVSLKVRSNSAASSAHFALGLAQMLRGNRIESLDHTAIALANYQSTGALQQAPVAIEIVASQLRSSPIAAVRRGRGQVAHEPNPSSWCRSSPRPSWHHSTQPARPLEAQVGRRPPAIADERDLVVTARPARAIPGRCQTTTSHGTCEARIGRCRWQTIDRSVLRPPAPRSGPQVRLL